MNEEGRLSKTLEIIEFTEKIMSEAISQGTFSELEIKNMYVDFIHYIMDFKNSLPNVESDEIVGIKNQLGYIQDRMSTKFRNYVGKNVDFSSYENIKESFEKFGASPKV